MLFGALLFPGANWWLLAVAALVVMPMDLAPVLMILRDERLPLRVRAALNIEGGFNDGLVSPFFVFCVANLVSVEGATFDDLLLNAVKGAACAVLAGATVGCLVGWLMPWCLRSGWATGAELRLAGLTLPFLAYAGSVQIGGNGFVAAFVAGLCYARIARRTGHDNLDLVRDVSHLMALAVWFTFGALIAKEFVHGVDLRVIGYALLALTVARMLPVFAALTGTRFTWTERGAVGWLGSRGVTSIVFAALAYSQLGHDDAAFVINVTCATVLLSVLLHGISLEPLARWFARRRRSRTDGSCQVPESFGP